MLELLLNLLLLLGLARRTKTSYGQYWRNETSCGPTEMKPPHGRMRVGHRKGEGELGSGRVSVEPINFIMCPCSRPALAE